MKLFEQKSKNTFILKESVDIVENKKLAAQYVDQGKLSKEDFDQIVSIDPTPNKKFSGWMAKQWIANVDKKFTIDDLRNTVEEFKVFNERGITKQKDIFQFQSFADLKKEVDRLNDEGSSLSSSDLENDYEVILDNENLYIASPNTHEASRKLGLSKFAYRDCGNGNKDSAWCITFKAPNHFNDYYYKQNMTFYYVLVKNEQIMDVLKKKMNRGNALRVSAFVVLDNGKLVVYDGTDSRLSDQEVGLFKKIIGIK